MHLTMWGVRCKLLIYKKVSLRLCVFGDMVENQTCWSLYRAASRKISKNTPWDDEVHVFFLKSDVISWSMKGNGVVSFKNLNKFIFLYTLDSNRGFSLYFPLSSCYERKTTQSSSDAFLNSVCTAGVCLWLGCLSQYLIFGMDEWCCLQVLFSKCPMALW